MRLLKNIGYLARCLQSGPQHEIHPVQNAAILWDQGQIIWAGPEKDLPNYSTAITSYDAAGKLVIPGLIDCHTHLAFGGWRAEEFKLRILGKSYLEISQAGGGIQSTVDATRSASSAALITRSLSFLSKMAQLGITTIEAKSGYGLDYENELKLLRIYRQLNELQAIEIVPTFLGAHQVPREYANKREDYLRLLIDDLMPAVSREKLAEFCDIFVEQGAFSIDEAKTILSAAKNNGFKLKLHVDQLSDYSGAALAVEMQAVSADHLEYISATSIKKLAGTGCVAVLLPLASLYANQPALNARKLLAADIPIAVATDFNPGSAPSYHLPMTLSIACLINKLTPAEALKAATIYAAQAISREQTQGSIEAGKKADFAMINAANPDEWLYQITANSCLMTIKSGEIIHQAP